MEQSKLPMEIIQEGILGIYDREHPRATIQFKLEIHSAAMAPSHQALTPPEIVLPAPSKRPAESKILQAQREFVPVPISLPERGIGVYNMFV
jgi:hypothetical protein